MKSSIIIWSLVAISPMLIGSIFFNVVCQLVDNGGSSTGVVIDDFLITPTVGPAPLCTDNNFFSYNSMFFSLLLLLTFLWTLTIISFHIYERISRSSRAWTRGVIFVVLSTFLFMQIYSESSPIFYFITAVVLFGILSVELLRLIRLIIGKGTKRGANK